MAKVTLHGEPVALNGELPAVGSTAPDFTLVNGELEEVSLYDLDNKKKLISIVPSLDTPICAMSSQKFSRAAKDRPNNIFVIVSADLPFAHSRLCDALKIENIQLLSTMQSDNFSKSYGVLISDGKLAGLCTRAVLILDEDNSVLYHELVPEITNEPNYDGALSALGN